MKVLVLGAGFGGLEIASCLSEEFGEDANVTVIDRTDGFVFGFSKLDVMFGRTTAEEVHHPYSDLDKPGVEFVSATITSIDPETRTVETDQGRFEGDFMVVALGADLHPEATPGLAEGGVEFYTEPGAFAAREVLEEFEGGRVVVGVLGAPFKCPPAPSETALLVADMLQERGLRDSSEVALLMPFGKPIPPSPDASEALLKAFEQRGIEWHPETRVTALDPERKVAIFEGGEMPYDLFLAVPKHSAPQVVLDSPLAGEDGYVEVDPVTLATPFPGVWGVGDVAHAGTPKAGVFSEGQAKVVAEAIASAKRGDGAPAREYDGRAHCYLEFGHDEVARVDIAFTAGEKPHGSLAGPAQEIAMDKAEFGRSRIRRWFDREWTTV